MFALPNVDVEEPIEVDGMALVSLRDDRIHQLIEKYTKLAEYVGKFEFGIWQQDFAQYHYLARRRAQAIQLYRSDKWI